MNAIGPTSFVPPRMTLSSGPTGSIAAAVPRPAASTSFGARKGILESRVLWAEDNPKDRMLIHESIDSMGPQPTLKLVPDGVVVLESLEHGLPALVVLDLKMPRLGGIDVLRRIRRNETWQNLPVTIFTSGNRPSEINECLALGVREVVEKPVDFDLFSAAVQRILHSALPSPP